MFITPEEAERRRKLVVEFMNNVKRKRRIKNKRLDSFSWWLDVEFIIQNELFSMLDRITEKGGDKK